MRISILSISRNISLLALGLSGSVSLSQNTNSCQVNNAGFELGNTTGWICKSGYYGYAPCPPTGACARMGYQYTGTGQINPNGINAPLTPAGDRHTITTGTGNDPNSVAPYLVPVVAPGGGKYSFRLGDGEGAPTFGGGTHPLFESAELVFPVTNQNASFTYRYAFFLNSPSASNHPYESMPLFEVLVKNDKDSIIPCGRYAVVPGNFPACGNAPGFLYGAPANGGQWWYKPWTDVALDLRDYIGRNVTIEFRTTDCFAKQGTGCTAYTPGSHSAYAYIDAYCSPVTVHSPIFCAGTSSVQVCGPTGYASYSWLPGPGYAGGDTSRCITVNNPVGGTTYTVNMTTVTGCVVTSTVYLSGTSLQVNSTTICAGQTAVLTAPGGGTNYSWSTGDTTSYITVSPTATTEYTVTAQSGSCTATGTATVTVGTPAAYVSPSTTLLCQGDSVVISAAAGGTYSWSTGETTNVITVYPTTSTTYSVSVILNGCQMAGAAAVTVLPSPAASVPPPVTICSGDSAVLTATPTGGTPPYTFGWSPASGLSNPAVSNPVAYPGATTAYTLTLTDSSGCKSNTSTTVTVESVPSITWQPWTPQLTCDGFTIPFNAMISGSSAYWDFGDGTTWTGFSATPSGSPPNPEPHTYPYNGTYSVTVTAYNGPCQYTADTLLAVGDLASYGTLLQDNVFTPNGDGKNDCFHPALRQAPMPGVATADEVAAALIQCIELQVFDRWGVKVFQSADSKHCWDGTTLKGTAAKEGTYYYVAKFKDTTVKGFVELIR